LASDAAAARRPLALSTIMAFAATSLPLSAMTIAISVFLPKYFASNIGISLAAVGSAFAIVRLIDIPLDPMLGMVMDRTRSPWGRYRLWTVIGTPILMLAVYMLFMAPPGIGTGYLIVWLLVMYLGFSILHLSHSAWASTLATSYNERARVFGVMTAVGVVGSATVLLTPLLLNQLGKTEAQGVQGMGWFILGLTPLAVALVVWRTPERIAPEVHGNQFKLKEYLSLVTRPEMARILLADLCLALGPGWMSALYLFFFTDSRGYTAGQASILLLVYILAGFAGAPLMGRLATRISKHRAPIVATTGYSLVLVSLMAIPQGSMLFGIVPMFIAGFFAAGFTVLIRAMTADVSDEVRLEQGKERAGLLFALTTLTNKVAGAFSIFLTFQVLARTGYDAKAGAVNTPEAIHSMELAYLIGPIVFVTIGGACFLGYRLTAERHAEIRRQLEERDASLADDHVFYDEAAILESVTTEPGVPTVLVEPKRV
jgi:Na+/melibiose symporter-like transporter